MSISKPINIFIGMDEFSNQTDPIQNQISSIIPLFIFLLVDGTPMDTPMGLHFGIMLFYQTSWLRRDILLKSKHKFNLIRLMHLNNVKTYNRSRRTPHTSISMNNFWICRVWPPFKLLKKKLIKCSNTYN